MREPIYKFLLLVSLGLVLLPALSRAQSSLVNLNTAGISELKTLNGIGEVKAQAIMDYRTQNGPFQTIEEVKNVSGIGEATYANIKDYITVAVVNTPSSNPTSGNTIEVQGTGAVSSSSNSTDKLFWLVDNKSSEFKVSIASDRSGTVGTPLVFKAETNFGFIKRTVFEWKFGDGSVGYGQDVTHTYSYPGEYVLILHAKVPDGDIVARSSVKIIAPALLASMASPERIEIANNSSSEVNLYGRALMSSGQVFLFPEDTIILAGQKISFSSTVTGLKPLNASEVSFLVTGNHPTPQDVTFLVSEEKSKQVANMQMKLDELKTQLAQITHTTNPPSIAIVEEPPSGVSQTAIALEGATNIRESKVSQWFETIKHFFLRTQ